MFLNLKEALNLPSLSELKVQILLRQEIVKKLTAPYSLVLLHEIKQLNDCLSLREQLIAYEQVCRGKN